MTRRNPPAKWVLPTVVNPAGRKCFVINVPDEPQHIAAFRGAMLDLASAYKWADDLAHTARDVALVWRDVINEMESCPMPLQFRTNPFNNCSLEVSYDGGEVWIQIFNAAACVIDNIKDSLGNDTPAGGGSPEPEQCFDLDLIVEGNSMKIIPLAIRSGWSLQISEASGAWSDGSFIAQWVCPDGRQYSLGSCSLPVGTQSGDPINTQPHMRLILRLADGTYAAIPLDGSIYTVPAGQPEGNYFLMANDSVLADNQGSVSLHLLACNTAYDVTWDVVQGSGPRGANYGDEVTFTSTGPYPAQFYFNNFSTPCLTYQVVSLTGYNFLTGYGYVWNGTDCSNNFYFDDNWATKTPLDWVDTLCVKGTQFQGATQFTITLKILAAC